MILARTKKQWLFDSLLLVMTVLIACLYFWFNAPHDNLYVLKNGIDELIPRLPIFILPYLAFLPWFWLVVFYAYLTNKYFRHLALATIVTNLVAFVVYTLFQTHIIREPIIDVDIFSQLLAYLYAHDQPYAAFPSLHSGMSAVVATYFVMIRSKWALAFVAMASLVVISTLFTKQHYILDALSGVSLGVLATIVIFKLVAVRS